MQGQNWLPTVLSGGKKGSQGEEDFTGGKEDWCGKKGGSYSRPARCLEGDGGSQGCGCAVCWDFSGVKWREGAAALWRPGACATENRVAGGHIVAGLGCQGPSIGYRQLACPCAARSGRDYGVRLAEDARAGCSSINHGDLLRARDVGEAGSLEGDGKG